MEQEKTCYLCGHNRFEKLEGTVRDNPSLSVLKCKNCSLVFLSSFSHIDSDFYCNDGMHNGQPDIENWLEQTKDDDKRRFKFLKSRIKGKKILDFGCGNGGFLSAISDCGQKSASLACGVELQKSMFEYFENKNLKVFEDIQEIDEKFDYITLFHVLEHIKDPAEMLKNIGEKLEKNGQIIIEVPNSNDALITIYKSKAFMDFTYWGCHLFVFNEKTLRKIAKRAGFKINYTKRVQRYGIANHLYWHFAKMPGGHKKWWFIDCRIMNAFYRAFLALLRANDTIVMSISKQV